MIRTVKAIVLSVFFLMTMSGISQEISGTRGKATKQATIRVSNINQVPPEDAAPFKIPNKNWSLPELSVDQEDVIYLEPKGFRKVSSRDIRLQSPPPDTSFLGLPDNGSSIPPDVNGAAGPEHIMVTLNTQVRIQDREGNNLFTTSLSTFWQPMPNNGGTFDPKILYDPYENRWIMVTPSGSNSQDSRLYVAVSATSNPLEDWFMFWIDPDEQNITWFDYPSIGFNKRWITISGNMFGGSYYRTVFVIDKMAAYNGDENPSYKRFATSEAFTLCPSITYDPDEEDQWLVATSNGNSGGYGYIKKFKLFGETLDPTFIYEGAIGVPEPWAGGAGQNGDFLPQLGSSEKLNAVDSRMENLVFRNDKLWAVHHIFLPANNPQRTAVQWWELALDGTVLQRGRIEDTTNLFSFAFPTIAVNANEDIFIGHNACSETQYASAAYSFKAYYDEENTMRTYYQFKDGKDPYYKTFGGGRNRWGDYTNTVVDPVNDFDFWTLQEYAETSTGSDHWGTWWAYLKPSFPPVANFTSDEVLIPLGETVDFTDLTGGVPSEWNWYFEGGEPSTSTLQNPSGIKYNEEGSFTVTLTAANELGTDTDTKVAYITVSASLLPEVNFEADKQSVCIGEAVKFTDMTLNSPIQWQWQFTPSNVSFVDGTDATSENPVVVFNEAESYSVTLTVWNMNGSSELTQFDMVMAGGFIPYYKETFELPSFNSGAWTVENPDNDVSWELFEVGGTGPGNIAAGVDFSKYYTIGQRDRLISPSFNLTAMNNASLDLLYAYAKKHNELTDSLIIYVSGDCGENWTRVYQGGEDGSGNFATHPQTDNFWPTNHNDWCYGGWGASCIGIDLTPWAGLADVRIAFETYSGYGNPIFIDNIEISQFVGEEENAIQDSEVNVFPNPASGDFNITLPEGTEFTQIELINQLGKSVYQADIRSGEKTIHIRKNSGWAPGIYFLKVNSTLNSIVHRVILY